MSQGILEGMNRQTILLLFGGESSEHDVSIMSARNVYAGMNKDIYDVRLCYITRSGTGWLLVGSFDDLRGPAFFPLLGQSYFRTQEEELRVDVIFPVLHGENGVEDGAIQGLASLLHAPIVGSGILASAVCWNKVMTKQLLAANGIQVTPYAVYRRGEPLPEYEKLASELSRELFVKPATAGSSVGVSKVRAAGELEPAIKVALKNSDTVLIEKAITGRELEVAVLGTPPNHRTSGVGEIIPGEEFYSYDDKYAEDSKAQVLSNATLSDDLRQQLQDTAHDAFAILGCKGLARVDFLVSESGEIYVNELNTLPGFTNISQYPKLWQQSGISYPELIGLLIADASM